jgi:hypothetical protein
MGVVRQLCGIVAGATGSERTFQVPQPGEKVLISRTAIFENGFVMYDKGSGRVTANMHNDRAEGYFEPADFDANESVNGAAVPCDSHESTLVPMCIDNTYDFFFSSGGVQSAGPIGCDVTHGDGNHGEPEATDDYAGNSYGDGAEEPSSGWYDWRFWTDDGETLFFYTIRNANTIGMFRWAGVDTDDKLRTVTGQEGHTGDYTGYDSLKPLLSAVRGEMRNMVVENNPFEIAAFHSHFGPTCSSPSKQWDLWGNANDGLNVKKLTGRESVTAGTSTSTGELSIKTYQSTTPREYKFANNSGNLRLTSATNASIDFKSNGTVKFLNTTDNDGGAATTTGSVMFDGGVYIKKNLNVEVDLYVYMTSDERLKKNISTFKNATKMIGKLRGAEFDWREEANQPNVHDYGVIAQDVQKVLPHAVKERKDGTLAVDYLKITPLLIEAVKELTERVKELENKNKTSF